MKSQLVFVWLSALAFVTTSCGPMIYSNVGQNVPLFTEKGQANLSTGLGLTESSVGFQLQGAIAPGDRVAVISSINFLAGSDSWSWDWNAFYADVGVGTFGKSGNSKFVWEVFGGIGVGSISNSDTYYGEYLNVDYIKPFVQPSFGFKHKVVEFAFTPRIGLVHFTSYDSNAITYSYDYEDEVPFEFLISEKRTNFAFEPGFMIRVGKKVKFQYQLNITSIGYGGYYEEASQNLYMSFGATFSWSEVMKKKN